MIQFSFHYQSIPLNSLLRNPSYEFLNQVCLCFYFNDNLISGKMIEYEKSVRKKEKKKPNNFSQVFGWTVKKKSCVSSTIIFHIFFFMRKQLLRNF